MNTTTNPAIYPTCNRVLSLGRSAILHMDQPCPVQMHIANRKAPRNRGLLLICASNRGIIFQDKLFFFVGALVLPSTVVMRSKGCP